MVSGRPAVPLPQEGGPLRAAGARLTVLFDDMEQDVGKFKALVSPFTHPALKTVAHACSQIDQDAFTVFDFWAAWCGPCKIMSPIFEKLSQQFPSVQFFKVNVDEAGDISEEVGIRAVRNISARPTYPRRS